VHHIKEKVERHEKMLEQITNSKFGGGKVLCESVQDTQLDRDGILSNFKGVC